MEILKPLGVGGITKNIVSRRQFTFTSQLDTFEITSNDRYTNEPAIRRMIDSRVKNIVKDFNPELKLNMKELKELLQHHALDTKTIACGITDNLPFSLQNKVDKKSLADAAYFHDLGKVLIPKNILNKPDKLNIQEEKIMQMHPQISYELLKNSDINEKTLKLIQNHHQNLKKAGFFDKNSVMDLELQILTVADKYSALTEKRVYKDNFTPKQALTIIYQDVKEGKLHPFVFKALTDYVAYNTPSKYQFVPS